MKQRLMQQRSTVHGHTTPGTTSGYQCSSQRETSHLFSHLMRTFVLIAVMVMSVGNVWGIDILKRTEISFANTCGANAEWNSSTKTYSWTYSTDSSKDYKLQITCSSGNWSDYDGLYINTSDYTGNSFQLVVKTSDGTQYAKAYWNNVTNNISWSDFTHWQNGPLTTAQLNGATLYLEGNDYYDSEHGASAPTGGSVTIKDLFLYKTIRTTDWDSNGHITLVPSDFPESAWNITRTNNTITKTESGYSNLVVPFSGEGIDIKSVVVDGTVSNNTSDGNTGTDGNVHNFIDNFIIKTKDGSTYPGRTLQDDVLSNQKMIQFELQFYHPGTLTLNETNSVIFKHKDIKIITYHYNATAYGAGDGTWTQEYYNTAITLPTPKDSPEGKVFVGWFDAASGGNLVGYGGKNDYAPSSDVTLYAHWADQESSTMIGDIDKTIEVDKSFSPIKAIAKGKQQTFTFTNHSNGQNMWNNWILHLTPNQDKTGNYVYTNLALTRFIKTDTSDNMYAEGNNEVSKVYLKTSSGLDLVDRRRRKEYLP